ncbi:MAG: DUF5675 family protein [Candidatus Woesearchaeota archaeon]
MDYDLILYRQKKVDGAVLGKILTRTGKEYNTLENEKYIFPAGEYKAFRRYSKKNGRVIELKNVRGRSYIQLHAGNYKNDTEGCVLVGEGVTEKIPAVWNSFKAMNSILREIKDKENIKIKVKEVY